MFLKTASFWPSKFHGRASFFEVAFNKANFRVSEFHGVAVFTFCTFNLADFIDTSFENEASFTFAQFGGTANFVRARFEATTDFQKALIYSTAVSLLQRPEPRPLTPLASAAVLVQTIFGPVQVALLILAIRRRFMR